MKNKNRLVDEVIAYIHHEAKGVSSVILAARFLKFNNPTHQMAHRAITGILQNDYRCELKSDGLWYPRMLHAHSGHRGLLDIPWTVVHLLQSSRHDTNQILHLSLWIPSESPQHLYSGWLVNPDSLSIDSQELLRSDYDAPFQSQETTLIQAIPFLNNRSILFLSFRQRQFALKYFSSIGAYLTDDTYILSHLLKLIPFSLPKETTIESYYRCLFNAEPVLGSAYRYGETLCACCRESIVRLINDGISTQNLLEQHEQHKNLYCEWSHSTFSINDIMELPQVTGVYGFKNKQKEHIYIGKAKNLRQRLLNYCRLSSESPAKLTQLRDQAHTLTIHLCGSELESILYEHRLIKKYNPVLNVQKNIHERKGTFSPLTDCIVLLPHAEKEKGMSFWYRQNQKVNIRPFYTDFQDIAAITNELEAFFFLKKLPIHETDFAEEELFLRWVKRHQDFLTIVPVYRMSNAEEICNAIIHYWKDITD